MYRTAFFILTLLCTQLKAQEPADTNITVFPCDTIYTLFAWGIIGESDVTLSSEELETTDSVLRVCMSEHYFSMNLARYKRQYVPVINAKGEKEVWVNCFCSRRHTTYWRKAIVQVEDGGDCYFNLKINLSTKKYYALSINGNS